MEIQMSLPDAWRHFIDNLPDDLTRAQKNEVRQAQRDEPRAKLGERRIARLLTTYGQGHYRIETKTVVFVK